MAYSVQLLWANNAQTTLAGSISNTATSANLASGSGILFPTPGAGQGFVGTFTDQATGLIHEVVLVTGITGDTITMQRGQEGTTPVAWSANDLFANLWTKGTAQTLIQLYQLQEQSTNYAVDSGVTNAYVVGFTPAITTAPTAGTPMRIKVQAGNTNTGACTINGGWGVVPVVRRDGSACIGGEMVGGNEVDLSWNGTSAQLLGLAPATSAAAAAGTDTQSAVTPAQLAATSFSPTGYISLAAALYPDTGWLNCYGQNVSRTTYATLLAAITTTSVVTISIATPGVIGWASQPMRSGDIVSFETTGSLPTGLSTATNYFVVNPSTNSFQVALTAGGSPIATSGSQTGIQTCRWNPFGCGNGTTTFGLPNAQEAMFFATGGTFQDKITIAGSGVNPVLGGTGGQENETYSGTTTQPSAAYSNVGSGGINVAAVTHTHDYSGTVITMPNVLGLNVFIKT